MVKIVSMKWKEAGWKLEQSDGRLTAQLADPAHADLTSWTHLLTVLVPRIIPSYEETLGPRPGDLPGKPEDVYEWTWGHA